MRIIPRLLDDKPVLFLPDDTWRDFMGLMGGAAGYDRVKVDVYRRSKPPNERALKWARTYARKIDGVVMWRIRNDTHNPPRPPQGSPKGN